MRSPVGMNLYVASGITKMGINEPTVAVWPWLLTMLVFLVPITYWQPLTPRFPETPGMTKPGGGGNARRAAATNPAPPSTALYH